MAGLDRLNNHDYPSTKPEQIDTGLEMMKDISERNIGPFTRRRGAILFRLLAQYFEQLSSLKINAGMHSKLQVPDPCWYRQSAGTSAISSSHEGLYFHEDNKPNSNIACLNWHICGY
jgi:hypothetical protein